HLTPHPRARAHPLLRFCPPPKRGLFPLGPPLAAHKDFPPPGPPALPQTPPNPPRRVGGEIDQPLAPVLALPYPQRVPPQIDIHDLEADHLRHAYATAQEDQEQRPVPRRANLGPDVDELPITGGTRQGPGFLEEVPLAHGVHQPWHVVVSQVFIELAYRREFAMNRFSSDPLGLQVLDNTSNIGSGHRWQRLVDHLVDLRHGVEIVTHRVTR